MKYIYSFIFCLFLLTTIAASAKDYVLVPENFYLHQGDKLAMHLISANQFTKQDELGFDPAKMEKFVLSAGSKKSEKQIATKAGDSVAVIQLEKEGQIGRAS